MESPAPRLGDIESVYQPIIDLSTRQLVGFEALTRPAAGSRWTSPEGLFAEAARCRSTADFDWWCRASAVRGALDAGFPDSMSLFVNSEPAALDAPPPDYARQVIADASSMSITVEITERHLMNDPAGLLRASAHARDMGWRIAIDDVGADPSSLALLALLRPDVIKLEMQLVHEGVDAGTHGVLAAVIAESKRTGAVIVAEGIETEAHERWAQEIGAAWGQGWLYGAPAPLPHFEASVAESVPRRTGPAVTVRAPMAMTPFALTHGHGDATTVDEAALDGLEVDLLERAASSGPASLILVTVDASTGITDSRSSDLERVGSSSALTVVFTPSSRGHLRLRQVVVDPDEPLASERSIIIVSPTFTAALCAVARGTSPDGTRLYDCRIDHERDKVLDAATLLLHRVPALE